MKVEVHWESLNAASADIPACCGYTPALAFRGRIQWFAWRYYVEDGGVDVGVLNGWRAGRPRSGHPSVMQPGCTCIASPPRIGELDATELHMTFLYIQLASLAGGVISVLLAATLALTFLARFADRMVAYAVGVLLTFALTDLLPEAIEQGLSPMLSGQWLLGGIMAFFLMEKAALWRHDHVHGHDHEPGHDHDHAHDHAAHDHPPQVPMIVLGDALHNFVDGILIAAAFLTDPVLGWSTAAAILAHELPHEIGNFMVLLSAGLSKMRALFLNALAGAAMMLGGAIGYFALGNAQAAIPYVLVIAASSFIYIAVADLVPELHRHRRFQDAAAQLALMGVGVATVHLFATLAGHGH
jgi:zinc and cadmium transporter